MYKQVLETVENIEIWPIIALIIFFVFFLGVLIFVIRTDKDHIRKMEDLPLHDGSEKKTNKPIQDFK